MRLGYRWLCRSALLSPKHILVGFGLFAIPLSVCSDGFADGLTVLPRSLEIKMPLETQQAAPQTQQAAKDAACPLDPRVLKLQKFLAKLHCPVKEFANEFVVAADNNKLDWRLLPSISVVESGGGKSCRNNNIFGWNQGFHVFSSVRSSIQEMAEKLAGSPLYRRHGDVAGKLRVYNRNDKYVASVVSLMDRIGAIPARNF